MLFPRFCSPKRLLVYGQTLQPLLKESNFILMILRMEEMSHTTELKKKKHTLPKRSLVWEVLIQLAWAVYFLSILYVDPSQNSVDSTPSMPKPQKDLTVAHQSQIMISRAAQKQVIKIPKRRMMKLNTKVFFEVWSKINNFPKKKNQKKHKIIMKKKLKTSQ